MYYSPCQEYSCGYEFSNMSYCDVCTKCTLISAVHVHARDSSMVNVLVHCAVSIAAFMSVDLVFYDY